MLIVVHHETPPHGDKIDPNFQYGSTQAMLSLLLLSVSFVTTILSLILAQRCKRVQEPIARPPSGEDDPSRYLLEDTEDSIERERPESISEDVEDISVTNGCSTNCRARRGAGRYRCDSEQRDYNSSLLERYAVPLGNEALGHISPLEVQDDFDITKHTVLLLLLCVSMFVGIALCVWTLVMEKMSGIYVELVFLDGFLNFGQGFFTFAVFGLDAKYVLMPIQKWLRKKIYGQESLILPDWEDLDEETKRQCQQFLRHHISNCLQTLVRDIRHRLITHNAVFRGSEFVDWLIEADLVSNRQDGVNYGRNLVRGRVVRHVDDYLDFYDDNFLYAFSRHH